MAILVTFLTLFFPAVLIPFNCVLFVKDRKNGVLYSALIALGMAAIAFNINPPINQNTDIVRHYANLEAAKNMSFSQAMSNDLFKSLMGYYIILKLISFTGINGILPASVTFIGYFSCLYLIHKFDIVKDSYLRFIALFLFVSAISFLGFCTGIRQYLVFSIIALLFYVELVKKKFRICSWIMYFLLITIHTSVMLIIMLRIIMLLLNNNSNYKYAILVFAWSLIQNSVISILADNFAGNIYIDKFIELAGFYNENGSEFIIPTFLYRLVLSCFCAYITFYILSTLNKDETYLKKYLVATLTVCSFTLGGFTSYDIFARFSMFSGMLAIPLIPLYFKRLNITTSNLFRLIVPFFTVLVLLYNINLYTTITFNSFYDICLTNIFTFFGV